MAVGFYSGTSTGPNDLIDKLRLAAIAESWTVNAFSAVGAGYRLHIQKTASDSTEMYFNLRSAIDEYGTTITMDNINSASYKHTGLLVNGSTGYDVGESWDKQTGYLSNSDSNSFACSMTPMSVSAIPSYYFFFVGDSVHIVVEVTSGKFQMLSFGMLNKDGAGAYTGGMYFTGTITSMYGLADWLVSANVNQLTPRYFSPATGTGGTASTFPAHGAVYVDVDSVAAWRQCRDYNGFHQSLFSCVSGGYGAWYNISTQRGFCSCFYGISPSFYNAMAPMAPCYTFLKRTDLNYSLAGWPDGVRHLNVTNYSPAQELTYGAEKWLVFPNSGIDKTPDYPYAGFAFLKDDGS